MKGVNIDYTQLFAVQYTNEVLGLEISYGFPLENFYEVFVDVSPHCSVLVCAMLMLCINHLLLHLV